MGNGLGSENIKDKDWISQPTHVDFKGRNVDPLKRYKGEHVIGKFNFHSNAWDIGSTDT